MISKFFAKFKALRPAETLIADEKEIRSTYRYWRIRTLYSCFFGYAVFYFCRVNLPMAIPLMQEELGYSKTALGTIASALFIMYGIGKFINGIMADRANPRYFMAFGLLLSATVNLTFGILGILLSNIALSSIGMTIALMILVLLWGINGWFQAMGFPPGARLLSHWYSPSEYGRIWGIYGCSHQVGAATIYIISGYLLKIGWQYVFLFPGVFTGDVKDEKKLEELETQPPVRETLFKYVLNNKYIWFIGLGNLFLYIARYGIITWVPSFLRETKGIIITTKAGWSLGLFEILGILGMLSAGWISDKISKARRGPVMAIYMFILSFGIFWFWNTPGSNPVVLTFALAVCGFLVYGPLMLVSVAVAGFAGKKSAASASGFTGLLGYIGATLSGFGIGYVSDIYGIKTGFSLLIVSG
ncbi:MAG: MFS transporter, partial [Planctomycetota bacterium]